MNNLAQAFPTSDFCAQSAVQQLIEDELHQVNPVRFRLIQSLAGRSEKHQGTSRQLVDKKLQQLIHTYRQDCQAALQHLEQSRVKADSTADETTPAEQAQQPGLPELQRQLRAREIRQRYQTDNRRAFAAWIEQLSGATYEQSEAPTTFGQRMQRQEQEASRQLIADKKSQTTSQELKSIAAFRETWNRQHADQLVDTSVNQGPRDAGPLNPERLAIRSLSAIRELSPQYLKRFVGYVETLLWLQQIEQRKQPATTKKKPARKK